jgi:hypothetical protein
MDDDRVTEVNIQEILIRVERNIVLAIYERQQAQDL